jgi:cephalosporin hydroxylase
LWFAERKLLYETVRRYKPEVVFEIGTWYGGGSTYFISEALCHIGSGVLHTVEADSGRHRSAVNYYGAHLAHLLPHVVFHLGTSEDVYPDLLRGLGRVDMLFLDGASDPAQTLAEFKLFSPCLSAGSILVGHDWFQQKMDALRPVIEKSPEWAVLSVLMPPRSVGLAVCRRLAGAP